ncbi:MAG: helix-hairpin-helix domain-containing protein [Candidatus Nezhaarchaeota archaeon]|nr:helix-hairpin-helix domain-containing protein [Candidatus Nezhaarchaeota archaeon]
MEMSVYVVTDSREELSEVVRHLASMNVKVRFEKLEVADYVVSERVGIERKTVMDLASSIADGRVFEQVEALVEAFQRPVLIIEGSLSELYARRKFTPAQVQGALAYFIEQGVYVAPCSNPLDTAYFICSLAKREQLYSKELGLALLKLRLRRIRKKRVGVREAQIALLSSLPGVGFELAKRLLEHFGSPRRFFKATLDELTAVRGMGESRARKVVEILDTSFKTALSALSK